jgi:hypothetical protein
MRLTRENKNRHFRQEVTWIRKGTISQMSRYSAFIAESHSPAPNAVIPASPMTSGTARRADHDRDIEREQQDDEHREQHGEVDGRTPDRGRMSRGKYTFLMTSLMFSALPDARRSRS